MKGFFGMVTILHLITNLVVFPCPHNSTVLFLSRSLPHSALTSTLRLQEAKSWHPRSGIAFPPRPALNPRPGSTPFSGLGFWPFLRVRYVISWNPRNSRYGSLAFYFVRCRFWSSTFWSNPDALSLFLPLWFLFFLFFPCGDLFDLMIKIQKWYLLSGMFMHDHLLVWDGEIVYCLNHGHRMLLSSLIVSWELTVADLFLWYSIC